jgi:retinol dehydrogenase-12
MTATLEGKTCLVTGATSGIGRAAAEELAARGAGVFIVCRSTRKGEETIDTITRRTGNRDVHILEADLSSLDQVRKLAEDFLARERPLHVLLNNAGVVMLERTTTGDGHETTFAVNHLAYFLLTQRLVGRMRESAPARIVCVASEAHRFAGGRLDFDDLDGARSYGAMKNYGKSKLANILFVREMARRLEGSGVTINCLHPGMVGTGLGANNGRFGRIAMRLLRPFSRSPEKGAETAVYLCTAPEVAGMSGGYYYNCNPLQPNQAAANDDDARRLWRISEELTDTGGLQSPGS